MKLRVVGPLALVVAGCGDPAVSPDASVDTTPAPMADFSRDIVATALDVDIGTRTATARITLAGSDSEAASFEIGDLEIHAVRAPDLDVDLQFADRGDQLDVGVPRSSEPIVLDVTFTYAPHADFDGDGGAFTFTWPYYCGNLFPCKSDPADGVQLELTLTGVPEPLVAVYPTTIPGDAPSYMLAWALGAYVETPLGTTTDGTEVSVWHTDAQTARAATGTANLRAAFDWLEQTLGAYSFGPKVGTVAVAWGDGAYGGMEHHPLWHVGASDLDNQDTNVHEASHGWFGDGVRIACWEDLVLSEGTVTYLAGRALDVVAPEVGAQVWADNEAVLADLPEDELMWPDSCGEVDVLTDDLWNTSVYYRGAFFYRGVALAVGAEMLDQALATFYQAHVGGSATMAEMLTTIQDVTGFDPTACADAWLRSTTIPRIGPCQA